MESYKPSIQLIKTVLKKLTYSDLLYLLNGEDIESDFIEEVEVELTLRDIRLEQCTPEVN